jgi:HEPN domain-containing protein
VPINIAEEWLRKADEDFGFASAGLDHTDFFAQICFHFQQAAEKYLKAFIIARHLPFRSVHSLLELLESCKEQTAEFGQLTEACRYLNPFYIDARYPVHWPTQYDRETAMAAKRAAAEVGTLVKKHLVP